MKINNEKELLKKIKVIPITLLILFSITTTYFTIDHNRQIVKDEIRYTKQNFIDRYKKLIKREVDKVYNRIEFASKKDETLFGKLSQEEKQNHILKSIASTGYDKTGYIFIVDYEGNYLSTIKESLLGKNGIELKDKNGVYITKEIINAAKKGAGYISYESIEDTYKIQSEKISYIRGFDKWKWAIGYGFHPIDIKPQMDQQIRVLKNQNKDSMSKIFIMNFLLTLAVSFILIWFSKNIEGLFIRYKRELSFKEEKNRQKDEIIFHQSKTAAMGELLNIISHQWRQPLSQINGVTLDIYMEQKKGTLDDTLLRKHINDIETTTEYLSNTITDFSEFFIQEKNPSEFLVEEAVDECMKILKPSLKDVKIVKNINSSKPIQGYISLFQQIILSLITNSLDAFSQKNIEDRKILINVYENKGKVITEVIDNAGGIEQEHLKNIFDLYFSTKEKKTLSGLGLYISKKIVQTNMDGTIRVENFEDGAKFRIEI